FRAFDDEFVAGLLGSKPEHTFYTFGHGKDLGVNFAEHLGVEESATTRAKWFRWRAIAGRWRGVLGLDAKETLKKVAFFDLRSLRQSALADPSALIGLHEDVRSGRN